MEHDTKVQHVTRDHGACYAVTRYKGQCHRVTVHMVACHTVTCHTVSCHTAICHTITLSNISHVTGAGFWETLITDPGRSCKTTALPGWDRQVLF